VQALTPAAPVLGQRLAQLCPVAQLLDLCRRDPRLGQHLFRQQPCQPARIEPIGLGAAAAAEQSARLHRLRQPHLETIGDQLAPDPAPTGRRLDRHRRDAAPPRLRPAGKALPIRGEALLDHDTSLGIEHRRLERVLMDVDRRVQHHEPPSRRHRGPIVPQRSGQSPYDIQNATLAHFVVLLRKGRQRSIAGGTTFQRFAAIAFADGIATLAGTTSSPRNVETSSGRATNRAPTPSSRNVETSPGSGKPRRGFVGYAPATHRAGRRHVAQIGCGRDRAGPRGSHDPQLESRVTE
jgi:hypothetical protein